MAANLNRDERIQIQTLKDNGKKPSEIAKYVGRDRSTIYRELGRHTDADGRYNFIKACEQAKHNMTRISDRGPSGQTIAIIESKLTNQQWSPQKSKLGLSVIIMKR